MARLINPSKYYSNEEWAHSNNFNYAIAEKERENATALENEIDRLIDETNKRTDNTLADVNKKLDQRLNDIKFWKDEINKKLSDLTDETKQLDQCIPRLIKALEATDEPLHFAEQCVLNREGRKGIDLVSDDAHKNLLKEIDIYTTVQDLLKKCIEQADEQIRLNRKSIYILKKDSTDKLEAQHIEEYGRNLKTNHEVREEGKFLSSKKSFTPEEWQNSAADRVLSADSQIKNSRDLRSTLDGTLQQVATDQRNQVEATNLALAKRISETRNAKGELEEHLALVLKEISHIEDCIVDIEKAINDKKGPKQLTETRMGLRNQRPNVENCQDVPAYRLLQQKKELENDIASLNDRLAKSHASLKGLCRQQLNLEEEIAIKTNTLFIDEVECMGMRKSITIHAY